MILNKGFFKFNLRSFSLSGIFSLVGKGVASYPCILQKLFYFCIGMFRIVTILICLLATLTIVGQTDNDSTNWSLYKKSTPANADTSSTVTHPPGTMTIQEDEGINRLMKRHVSIVDSLGTMAGYRLQIFFASGPGSYKNAKAEKVRFIGKHTGLPAYITSENPDFKVRIGNFRTKLEAQGAQAKLKKDFPNSFIVKDNIELPNLN